MKYTAKDRQNIFDIAVIGAGATEAGYEIAYANGISVSRQITDMDMVVNEMHVKRVVEFFKSQTHLPASCDVMPQRAFDLTFDITFTR